MNGIRPRQGAATAARRKAAEVWRGTLPLRDVYWRWGVGGNMGFVLALLLVGLASGWEALWLWPLYLVSLAWFVLIFRGIWRSAGRYPGRPLWAYGARLGVLAGILRMAAEAALLLALPMLRG